jgi:hypothetical protein
VALKDFQRTLFQFVVPRGTPRARGTCHAVLLPSEQQHSAKTGQFTTGEMPLNTVCAKSVYFARLVVMFLFRRISVPKVEEQ